MLAAALVTGFVEGVWGWSVSVLALFPAAFFGNLILGTIMQACEAGEERDEPADAYIENSDT